MLVRFKRTVMDSHGVLYSWKMINPFHGSSYKNVRGVIDNTCSFAMNAITACLRARALTAWLVLLVCILKFVDAQSLIVPGALWYDTDGNEIQAHGTGILTVRISNDSLRCSCLAHLNMQVGSTFYWFGEDKADNSYLFSAVSCYSVGIHLKVFDWKPD